MEDTNNKSLYKQYYAAITISPEDACYVGHIANIPHIIGFHGDTLEEAQAAFIEAVDDYLDLCAKTGITPALP